MINLAVAGAVLHGIAPLTPDVPESALRAVLQGLAWCAWAGAFGFAARWSKVNTARTIPLSDKIPTGRAELGIACVVGFGALLRAAEPTSGAAADAPLRTAIHTWPLAGSVAVFVLLPAIGEEALFRGTALRIAAHRFGPWAAGAGSALLFGACHPAHPWAAALFGASLAALALTTGRAREAMAAHALHNALGLGWLLSSTPTVIPAG